MSKMADEQIQAIEALRMYFPVGSNVYTVLVHVSTSGMARDFRVIGMDPDGTGKPESADWAIARSGLYRQSTRFGHGIRVHGSGMDMSWHLVYTLGQHLYPEGFGCIGADCPSNDHTNGVPRTPDAPSRVPQLWHQSGGYALKRVTL